MKKFLSIIFVIFLNACTTISPVESSLFEKYIELTHKLTRENLEFEARNYISNSLLKNVDLKVDTTQDQVLFFSLMKKIESHSESTSENNGCLVINGFDKKNEPLTFLLSYKNERTWKIETININLLDDVSTFKTEATCE